MYHPTTRVLAVLELLQARGTVSGAELAARLEVDMRTVRRYVTMLTDLGIPVEARRGRHGGYRLRPGFRLPPLMLANDEALAVTLGLLLVRRMGQATVAPATEGALAKMERVLPEVLRAQVRALADVLALDLPTRSAMYGSRPQLPSPPILLALATATAAGRRVLLTYRDRDGIETARPFDPYGIAHLANTAWYTVGHCHLRGGVRVFRLDRVASVAPEGTPFVPPPGFDCVGYVQRSLTTLRVRWSVDIVLHATLDEARAVVSPLFATVTEEAGSVVLRCTANDLDWLARTLIGLPFDFDIRTPPELRDAFRRLGARVSGLIGAHPIPSS